MMQYNTKEVESVNAMFDDIAPHYDKLNKVLSFGIDKYWRKKLIKELSKTKPQKILDVATGTADLAIAISKTKPEKIVGVDISENMLEIGRKKIINKNLQSLISLQTADSANLPFEDSEFDCLTIAFGVRNFAELQKSLKECLRVMQPAAFIYVLEFSYPKNTIWKYLYSIYSKNIIPKIGKLLSKNKNAYTYLPETVKSFYKDKEFIKQMQEAGLNNCYYKSLSGGITNLYVGRK